MLRTQSLTFIFYNLKKKKITIVFGRINLIYTLFFFVKHASKYWLIYCIRFDLKCTSSTKNINPNFGQSFSNELIILVRLNLM